MSNENLTHKLANYFRKQIKSANPNLVVGMRRGKLPTVTVYKKKSSGTVHWVAQLYFLEDKLTVWLANTGKRADKNLEIAYSDPQQFDPPRLLKKIQNHIDKL